MGEAKFCTPPPKPLNQFGWLFKHIITSLQGVDVHNLVEIDLAVMNLHMCGKNVFSCVFFFVNLSICPVFRRATGHILTFTGS